MVTRHTVPGSDGSSATYLLFLLAGSLALRLSLKAVRERQGTLGKAMQRGNTSATKQGRRTELASASSWRLHASARPLAFLCISSTASLLVSGLARAISAW